MREELEAERLKVKELEQRLEQAARAWSLLKRNLPSRVFHMAGAAPLSRLLRRSPCSCIEEIEDEL